MESFFKKNAINYNKTHNSRTYLIINGEDNSAPLLAYFSLTFKEIFIENKEKNISKTLIKKLDGLNKNTDRVRSYLIGQIGKNYSVNNDLIHLPKIMEHIYAILKEANDRVGGRVILLECENKDKLIHLYEQSGFKFLQISKDKNNIALAQMVKVIEFS